MLVASPWKIHGVSLVVRILIGISYWYIEQTFDPI